MLGFPPGSLHMQLQTGVAEATFAAGCFAERVG